MAEGGVHRGRVNTEVAVLIRRSVNSLLAGSQTEAAQSELDLSAVFHFGDTVRANVMLSVTFAQLISPTISLPPSLASQIHTLFDLF